MVQMVQLLNEVIFTGPSGADGAVTECGCLQWAEWCRWCRYYMRMSSQGQVVQMVQSLNEVVFTGPGGADRTVFGRGSESDGSSGHHGGGV